MTLRATGWILAYARMTEVGAAGDGFTRYNGGAMYSIELGGKNAVVLGVANHRSIAWHIAQALHSAGANLYLTYQNERLGEGIRKLVDSRLRGNDGGGAGSDGGEGTGPADGEGTGSSDGGGAQSSEGGNDGGAAGAGSVTLIECDVSADENVEGAFSQIAAAGASVDFLVHSIAFANRDDLGGDFSKTGRDGFRIALEVSAYSLIPVARYAAPLMPEGSSIVTLTFSASDRVFPGYNIMGTAKAALENEVRQLAYELGPRGIRVNALSPGPLDTLSSRAIHGYVDMKRIQAERSPLQRNITHDEVAKAALFLLSDLSSGITGHVLPIDGGYQIAGV